MLSSARAKELARDAHDLLELLFVGGVHRPFQRIESGLHALLDRLGKRHRRVRGEKHVRHAELALQVADAVDQQPRVHERFAEVEHADLLDAGFAHLARDALEEPEIHVPLGLDFARAQRAEAAAVVAARRDLDLHARAARAARAFR